MNTTQNATTFHNIELPKTPEESRNALIKYIAKELEKGKTRKEVAAETAGVNKDQVSEVAKKELTVRKILSHDEDNRQFHANLNEEVIQAAGYNPRQRLFFEVETNEEEGKIVLNISKDKVEIESDEVAEE